MQCLWIVSQAGILLELVGASLVVFYAFTSKKAVMGLKADMDSLEKSIITIRNEVGSQFRKQVVGFLLFSAGLAMQFIGNFANVT